MKIVITAEDLAGVAHLSDKKAAQKLGVAKSTVWKYRHAAKDGKPTTMKSEYPPVGNYRLDVATDGTLTMDTRATEAPQPPSEVEQLLRDKGIDPDAYTVSYGFSEWESGDRVLTSTRVRAVPKFAAQAGTKLDPQELIDAISAPVEFQDIEGPEPDEMRTFVLCPSDMQIGKTSYHGGTEETVARVLASYDAAVNYLKDNPVDHIVIAELGDPLENFYNTSSQRETNDLDLTGQVRIARRLLLEGIKRLAPYAGRISYVTVPSNHGAVRVGFKAPAGDNHNDWGIEISHQLEDVVRENPDYDHVEFIRPAHLEESVSLVTNSNTVLGFVHGHQARAADKLGEWWKGQDHGRQATADADILLAGHWHSFRAFQSGNARWVLVSPASDPGSDWFTNITGEHSTSGMLSFTTANGMWEDLRIL